MLISYNWLKRFLPDLDLSNQELKKVLTEKTGEVESYSPLRVGISQVFCGEVLEVTDHPKSDHLHLVTVDIINDNSREQSLEIVCGAPNLRIGQKVAVCLPGGTVISSDPDAKKRTIVNIEKREVLGVVSNGMICSARELGLSEEHSGILELTPSTVVGTDLIANGLAPDTVFEIENKSISHRGDLFCHLGVARELYAILKLDKIHGVEHTHNILKSEHVNLPLEVKIESENCRRICAVTIKGVTVRPSPLWLQTQLLSVGIRPVNNIVDITNYIMLDLGQPMHAYDYQKLGGTELIARQAQKNEKIETLDGVEHELDDSMLVIAGSNSLLGIAGLMGGKSSEIDEFTTDIVLEAANFERFNNRRTSRKLNFRSDAGLRFEKGLDPEIARAALEYAISLILDIASGEVASEIIDIYPNPEAEKIIEFDINKVYRSLGINMPKEDIIGIMNRLGINTSHSAFVKVDGINPAVNTSYVNVIVPSFRQDLNIQEDLLEEIARMYGYDKIVPTLPLREIIPIRQNQLGILERKTKINLWKDGFSEMLNYSFVSQNLWMTSCLDVSKLCKLTNAMMPELEFMRNDLIPNLLEKSMQNLLERGEQDIKYYEWNRIVREELDENGIHVQPWTLGLVNISKNHSKTKLDITSQVFEILDSNNIEYKTKRIVEIDKDVSLLNIEIYHPAQSGIAYRKNEAGEIIILAKFGKLHPKVKDNFKFDSNLDIEIASLNVEEIAKIIDNKSNYYPVSDINITSLDLSIQLKGDTMAGNITAKINDYKISNLIKYEMIDRYVDDNVNSLTLRIWADKSEISKIQDEIYTKLEKDFEVKRR